MSSATTRRTLLAGLPHLIAFAPAIVVLATADGLPDPIASHFDLSGSADRYAGRGTVLAVTVALAVGLALLFGLCARQSGVGSPPGMRWDNGRVLVAASWATAGFLGAILLGSVAANLGLTDPAAAVLPWWTFPAGLATGAVAGVVAWLVTPSIPADGEEPEAVPAVPLGPAEQVSWSRTVGSPWIPAVGAVVVIIGCALGVTVHPAAGIITGVAGVAVVLNSQARVTVDRRGLTIMLGLLGWPRLHVPADEVASVTVADISPTGFGGWGYRIVPGGRGIILRAGPALVVTRRSGQQLTVTVDDPRTAAGVLAGVASSGGRPC
ncbi:DUF1648 domain-containing protein [Pseudonocardia xinjiangensis]|uniref:DUF1648 domain-containing protein n=1 Tax=Pseudonocardia xinjiangensis TaxID=75289 RepID=UPI003D8AE7E1